MPKSNSAAKLPLKRQKFVEAFVATGNQTKAARDAGYAKPRQEGHRLLTFAAVAEAVSRRMERVEKSMGADEAQARLALMAEGLIPTKVVRSKSPQGPTVRSEYDTIGATTTVAKIHKLLEDGAPVKAPTVNVNVILPQVPTRMLEELQALMKAKSQALEIEARPV